MKQVAVLILAGVAAASSGFAEAGRRGSLFKVFAGTDVEHQIERFNAARQVAAPGRERNINWDGGAVTDITHGATSNLPGDLFLNGGGDRQIVFTNVMASANNFTTLNGGHDNSWDRDTQLMQPFSGAVNIAPQVNRRGRGSRKVNIEFTLVDKETAGLVDGFGIVANLLDGNPRGAKMSFYDKYDNRIFRYKLPDLGHVRGQQFFIGAIGEGSPCLAALVARVEIDFGRLAQRPSHHSPHAAVEFSAVVDDWFFFLSVPSAFDP